MEDIEEIAPQELELKEVEVVDLEKSQTKDQSNDQKDKTGATSEQSTSSAKDSSPKANPSSAKTSGAKSSAKTKASAEATPTPQAPASQNTTTQIPTTQNQSWQPKSWPFGIHEKLEYSLAWAGIEGGRLALEVLEPKRLGDTVVIHYRGTVKSSKMLDLVYKVDDVIESWVRLSDHLPVRQEIKQNESSQWGRRIVQFHSDQRIAKFYSHVTKKDGRIEEINREDPISHFAQDIFGSLYFFRFIPDQRMNFAIHDKFKNWTTELTPIGKEHIAVGAGSFDTIKYRLKPRIQGQLEPKGDVEAWVTADSRRWLVRFRAKIKVGSITGELLAGKEGNPIQVPPPTMLTPYQLTETGEL